VVVAGICVVAVYFYWFYYGKRSRKYQKINFLSSVLPDNEGGILDEELHLEMEKLPDHVLIKPSNNSFETIESSFQIPVGIERLSWDEIDLHVSEGIEKSHNRTIIINRSVGEVLFRGYRNVNNGQIKKNGEDSFVIKAIGCLKSESYQVTHFINLYS
jgi:hypothetical protein